MSGKKIGNGWLVAVIVAIALGAGWLWLSGAFAPPSYTEKVVVEPQGYFFRVKASYTHGDEPIEFDYVAVCGYRTTIYRDNSRSNDGTYDPKVMIKATADGGALMLRTPRACKGQTTANRKAPSDLLPFIIWFDDVEDLTFGWGYASPDAYDSPRAQVKFHGATIEKATAEDWKAWRAKAEAEYESKGMLPGPWGYSYSLSRPDNKPYDPAIRLIAKNCRGYIRLKLPEEVRPQIREMWPADRPLYWVQPSIHGMPYDRYQLPDGTTQRALYPGRRKYLNFTMGTEIGEVGVPNRDGGGTLRGDAFIKYAADTFPLLPRSRSLDTLPSEPLSSYPRRLLVHDEMKGFVACGGDEPIDYIEKFDPEFRTKMHPIYHNDGLITADYNPLSLPHIIYQRDEYIFDEQAWPAHM